MKIKKITFSEICRLLANRDGDIKKCAAEIFGFALVLPDLICPELAAVIGSFSSFPIKEAVGVGKSILTVFKKSDNYYSSYENAHACSVFIRYHNNHLLHREFLYFADHLLSVRRYTSQGYRILNTFEINQFSAYASPNTPDLDFTATVVCYLQVLVKNGMYPAVKLLNPAMEAINIGDLYRTNPDSLPQLILLMDYDPQWLENGFEKMAQFVKEQGKTLPLSIYNDLCTLAKKTSLGAPLLAALDELLV
jgi:hypothetical protein